MAALVNKSYYRSNNNTIFVFFAHRDDKYKYSVENGKVGTEIYALMKIPHQTPFPPQPLKKFSFELIVLVWKQVYTIGTSTGFDPFTSPRWSS